MSEYGPLWKPLGALFTIMTVENCHLLGVCVFSRDLKTSTTQLIQNKTSEENGFSLKTKKPNILL